MTAPDEPDPPRRGCLVASVVGVTLILALVLLVWHVDHTWRNLCEPEGENGSAGFCQDP